MFEGLLPYAGLGVGVGLVFVLMFFSGHIQAGRAKFREGAILECLEGAGFKEKTYLLVRRMAVSHRDVQRKRTWVYSGTFYKISTDGSLKYSTTGGALQEHLAAIPIPG